MRLDAAKESILYERSLKLNMPFGCMMHGHVMEVAVSGISDSSYGDILWLADPTCLSRSAYEKKNSGRLTFYYIISDKQIPEDRYVPGQVLSRKMLQTMFDDIFDHENKWHIEWRLDKIYQVKQEAVLQLSAKTEEFEIPLEICIHGIDRNGMVPETKMISMIANESKKINFLVYPSESQVADLFEEILMKLELVSDMGVFLNLYEILSTCSVSGRQVISYFQEYSSKEPTFIKPARVKQLKSYRDHPYMKKRWEKYRKHQDKRELEWREVMDRVIHFLDPVWQAFLNKDIFLEDWMPELGRFLG